ncbi:MAG TPA: FecR domain-containing protein [Steroidobacteraceae bacterium]
MPTDPELERMEAAAQWLVRLHDSPDDETLVTAWLQWCEEDPRNLHEFKAAQSVWHAATPLDVDLTDADRDAVLADSNFNDASVVDANGLDTGGSDAGVSGARGEELAAFAPASQAISRPVFPTANTSRYRWLSSRPAIGLAATVLLGIGIGVAIFVLRANHEVSQSYATAVGGTGTSVLPDGSKVELGAGSRITTFYTAKLRSVSVDAGEAYFSVTKDPLRPFLVTAGNMHVTAVGTAFNVRRHPGRVVVAVSEGKVRLDSNAGGQAQPAGSDDSMRLVAGEQAVYSSASGSVTIAKIRAADVASWRSGVLKYVHEPLGSVVADLSRYYHKRIVINDAALSDLPFTGTVFSAKIDDALRAFEAVFPLQVVEHSDSVELVPRN